MPNIVQTVGNSTVTFTHPLINGGAAISIVNMKLESQYFKARQMLDNSKVVPIVGGSAITLTNSVRAGSFTTTVLHFSNKATDGDMVAIARALQQIGDSTGGTLRVTTTIGGVTDAVTYIAVTLKVFDNYLIAGNDVPEYPVEFNYQDYLLT